MAILKVKEYIKEQSCKTANEKLTDAFEEYLKAIGTKRIVFNAKQTKCFWIKLDFVFDLSSGRLPLGEIYTALISLKNRNDASGIAVKELCITPQLKNYDNFFKDARSVIAFIAYV